MTSSELIIKLTEGCMELSKEIEALKKRVDDLEQWKRGMEMYESEQAE